MEDPTPVPLKYLPPETQTPAGPRVKWVYIVVWIYLALWVVVLAAPLWVTWAFLDWDWHNIATMTVVASLLTIAGLSLVIVPVRKVKCRPVTRRSVWFPIIGSGFLIGVLLLSGGMAFTEFISEKLDLGTQLFFAALAVWVLWSGIFILMTFDGDPSGIGMKLHRWVMAGSVLELLVAVPTHIIVRRRPDCCAGIATGIGICMGVVVLFVAMGPSVLLLYYRRGRKILGK